MFLLLLRRVSACKTIAANPTATRTLRTERHDLGQFGAEIDAIATVPNAHHTVALEPRLFQLNQLMSIVEFDQNVLRLGHRRSNGAGRTKFAGLGQHQWVSGVGRSAALFRALGGCMK